MERDCDSNEGATCPAPKDDIVSPDQIQILRLVCVEKRQADRVTGSTMVKLVSPCPQIDIGEDDLPVCDSSSQIQHSLAEQRTRAQQPSQMGFQQQKTQKLQAMAHQQVKSSHAPVPKASTAKTEGRNSEARRTEARAAGSLESLLLHHAAGAARPKIVRQPTARFAAVFPSLNEQAIELLARQSEPETALDVLRQALAELNAEKKVQEGEPAYIHRLQHQQDNGQQLRLQLQQSNQTDCKQPGSTSQPEARLRGKPISQSKKQRMSPSSLLASKSSRQSLHLSQSKEFKSNEQKLQEGVLSPIEHIQGKPGNSVGNFFKKQKKNSQSPPSYAPTTKANAREVQSSTKCASSSSTYEPSTNILASSSIKSSLLTSPTSLCVVTLTQPELKEKTKESNLIVCLYYNLACCYQRLGLLEEAVEYLELASEQLEETVRFFEAQEEVIIKQKQIQSQQQLTQPGGASKYATEKPPQKSSELVQQQRAQTKISKPGVFGLNRQLASLPHQMALQLTNQSQKSEGSNAAGSQQSIRHTEPSKDKITIKDCSALSGRDRMTGQQPNSAADHLSSLLKESQRVTDAASTRGLPSSLLHRLSNESSKLHQNKAEAFSVLQDSSDLLLNLHNSAEQLVDTNTALIIPGASDQLQYASFTNNYPSLIEKLSSSGRNVSPVTTASIPPDSTAFSLGKNDPSGLITIEHILAEKMHKTRYQCKMNLQICALQSQQGKHQDALIFGRRAAQICFKLIKNAQLLCKRYVQQIQRHIQARATKMGAKDHYGNTLPTQPDQGSLGESSENRRAQKAQTEINDSCEDDYQAAQFYRKAAQTRIDSASSVSNYSISTHKLLQRLGSSSVAQQAEINRPHSSCSSSQSSKNSQLGLTKLRLSRCSLAKLMPATTVNGKNKHLSKLLEGGSRSSQDSSRHPSVGSQRESSTESLDRIHTFSLKNSNVNVANPRHSQSVVDSQFSLGEHKGVSVYQNFGPETSSSAAFDSCSGRKIDLPVAATKKIEEAKATCLQKYVQEADLFEGKEKGQPHKNVYVEEAVKVLQSLIIQADPLLQELASIVKEFEDKSRKSAIDRDQEMIKQYGQVDFKDRRKRLKISFSNLKEVSNIERDQRFKLNVRNTLGVKNSQDWIFNLNIGNVMHLNMMKEQELNAKIENTHELTKDTMLEKVVLITSAYFCVATEIRFILQKDLLDVKLITKKDSEAFHAKALHIALLFLPSDCPLAQYIQETYCKNYLQPKMKLQQQRNAYLSQKLSKQHQARQRQLAQSQAEKEQRKGSDQPSKRPLTAYAKDATPAKLLISTKSLEGQSEASLCPNRKQADDELTIAPQTTKAGNEKLVKMTALRKTGATPDLHCKKQSLIDQKKSFKQAVLVTQASRQSIAFKNSRPSITLHSKKMKTELTSWILHRPQPSVSVAEPTSIINLKVSGSLTKQKVKSPKICPHAYQSAKEMAQGLRKQRDSSSVRKVKIDLGQIKKIDSSIERPYGQTNISHRCKRKQVTQNNVSMIGSVSQITVQICGQQCPESCRSALKLHHQRSSSLQRLAEKQQAENANNLLSSGSGQVTANSWVYQTKQTSQDHKKSNSVQSNKSQTRKAHAKQQSHQVRQSKGDTSSTAAVDLSSLLASAGIVEPQSTLKSPIKGSSSAKPFQPASQRSEKQHKIMLAAIQLLKFKQQEQRKNQIS